MSSHPASAAQHHGLHPPPEARLQANIKRTIGGVENIYKFPARASDAMALLQEVDTDHAALLDVFHDLSSLLSTLSVAEDLLSDLRRQATLARARHPRHHPPVRQ